VRDPALKLPGVLLDVGAEALVVLVGDDTTGVASGGCGHLVAIVFEEDSLAGVAPLGDLVVLDGILMAVRPDAPDMEGQQLGVLVEGDLDDAVVTPGLAKDLHGMAVVFGGLPIGSDGQGRLVEQDDSGGLRGVGRQLLCCGSTHPVGHRVLGRGMGQGEKTKASYGKQNQRRDRTQRGSLAREHRYLSRAQDQGSDTYPKDRSDPWRFSSFRAHPFIRLPPLESKDLERGRRSGLRDAEGP
jgi:hypothetical protein